MRPIYTAFYTLNTLYEQEAARLRGSLDTLGLPHDLRGVESLGSWEANTQQTVRHILTMMDAYPDRPIVQLDADAIVMRRPDLFESGIDCDVAGHFRRGTELLNGTLYISPTPGARLVMEKYREGVESHPQHRNEQHWLQVAVLESSALFKFYDLPASYCFIPDIMRNDIAAGEIPVIQQNQASREQSRCEHWARRRKWIEDYDAAQAEIVREKRMVEASA